MSTARRQVLVRVAAAGIGAWNALIREPGKFMLQG